MRNILYFIAILSLPVTAFAGEGEFYPGQRADEMAYKQQEMQMKMHDTEEGIANQQFDSQMRQEQMQRNMNAMQEQINSNRIFGDGQ